MEGVLYKWTNYISGWQPRWFVLEGGTLSYYDSQEDAWKGCKGSIKISVCEIQVHPSDFTRVDLIIPGEQYFYLRAINAAERQKWLVALGTAKACLTDNRTKREKELQENTDALKTKMSELRLYRDLLLQQVNKIQESSQAEMAADSGEVGDETGNLVKSTCTTFLKTLEECMQIASRTFNPDLLSRTPLGSPPVATIKPHKIKPTDPRNQHPGEKQKVLINISGTSAHESGPENEPPPSSQENMPTSPTRSGLMEGQREPMEPRNGSSSSTRDPEESVGEEKDIPTEEVDLPQEKQEEVSLSPTQNKEEKVTEEIQADLEVNEPQSENKQEEEDKVDTFFSTMSHRFSDIILEDDSGIPTQAFLDSCYAIVPVLDKLGPTVFAPVRIDFVGNIKKIQQKVVSDPESFPTLQSIVQHEVETEVTQVRNSATEALLWLKRGLKFLKEFLSEINTGIKDVQGALNNAYGKTLRQYHGWVVRGVFALALRAAPSYEGFMAALVSHEGDELKEGFTTGMHQDLDFYLPAMEKQLSILDALYEEYGLESDEIV
ncbi:pleckstrin homology domain-containing family A member 8-like [Sinocyclocheilus rhinocerous]|uniref:Pleckstrin homology domain-containing family A member 8 n=1 Tax=Sinocyclocheilus rhinocerous TaxID=307959 RepID=A0A673GYF3_9TELE|nr:PREDICTED: pleckstrin homology domain-containing family A member 8-like [Sinocyclocheilus rhinocerous]